MKNHSICPKVTIAVLIGAIAIIGACQSGEITPYSPYNTQADRQFMTEQYTAFLANWPAPYTSRMIPTALGSTHVLINGPEDGEPVILFHGAMANALMWKDVVLSLQETHRTIAVDIVGHFGKSIPVQGSIDDDELVAWVDEILDYLSLKKITVIGTSFGGWLAMRYAIASTSRIEKLVLIAAAPVSARYSFKFIAKSARTMAKPTDENVEELISYMLAPASQPDKKLVAFMKESLERGSPIMPKPSGFGKNELAVVTQPVLVLAGQYDRLFEPERVEKYSYRRFSNVKVVTINDAGHFLFYEQPELVNQHIGAFLGREQKAKLRSP